MLISGLLWQLNHHTVQKPGNTTFFISKPHPVAVFISFIFNPPIIKKHLALQKCEKCFTFCRQRFWTTVHIYHVHTEQEGTANEHRPWERGGSGRAAGPRCPRSGAGGAAGRSRSTAQQPRRPATRGDVGSTTGTAPRGPRSCSAPRPPPDPERSPHTGIWPLSFLFLQPLFHNHSEKLRKHPALNLVTAYWA